MIDELLNEIQKRHNRVPQHLYSRGKNISGNPWSILRINRDGTVSVVAVVNPGLIPDDGEALADFYSSAYDDIGYLLALVKRQ